TGVQTCALPIYDGDGVLRPHRSTAGRDRQVEGLRFEDRRVPLRLELREAGVIRLLHAPASHVDGLSRGGLLLLGQRTEGPAPQGDGAAVPQVGGLRRGEAREIGRRDDRALGVRGMSRQRLLVDPYVDRVASVFAHLCCILTVLARRRDLRRGVPTSRYRLVDPPTGSRRPSLRPRRSRTRTP